MKKQTNKINLIYILSFLGDSLFSPFLALYFASLNIDNFKKGILLAIIPLSSILGSFFYSLLSKKGKRNLLITRVLLFFQIIAFSLMGFIKNYILVLILTIIFSFHNNTYFSFQDGIAIEVTSKENKIYAKTRMFGSIGYLLGSLIGGKLIDLSSYGIVFLVAGGIYFIIELLFFFIHIEEEDKILTNEKTTFKELFKNKELIVYLLFYILVLGSWNIEESYVSLFFKEYGLTTSMWGYFFALQVLMEILTILLFTNMKKHKINPRILLLFSILLMLFRSLLLSINYYLYVKCTLNSLLRGIAWGCFLTSHVENLKKIVPEKSITKAILTLQISMNIFVSLGNYLSPFIYEKLSYSILYLILFLVQLVGFILILIFSIFKKKKLDQN